jgi:chromosome segregation ATPase
VDNDESRREQDLRKKMEESQRKLTQLQEHHTHLVGMQLRVRERLNEARQAQRALLAEEANGTEVLEEEEEVVGPEAPTPGNIERLERETEVLRDKLEQLENKKQHMDHLVQELQAVELGERANFVRILILFFF